MGAPAPLLAGQTLPAEVAQHFGTAFTSYTPTLEGSTTDPTLGSPGQVAKGFWSQQGDLVFVQIYIQFGTAGAAAGSGAYSVTLPAAAPILDYGMNRFAAGYGIIEDNSGADDRLVHPVWISGDATDRIRIGTAEGSGFVGDNAPWVWAASDKIVLTFWYPGNF